MAAPVGGLLWALGAFALRIGYQYISARVKGHHFDAFDRPPRATPSIHTDEVASDDSERQDAIEDVERSNVKAGKVF